MNNNQNATLGDLLGDKMAEAKAKIADKEIGVGVSTSKNKPGAKTKSRSATVKVSKKAIGYHPLICPVLVRRIETNAVVKELFTCDSYFRKKVRSKRMPSYLPLTLDRPEL